MSIVRALIPLMALTACTKESATPKTELSCQWQIMESYPEQVNGTCTLDTNKESLEIPLADLQPLAATFTIEINGKALDAAMYKLDVEKKLVTISPLSSDLRKGTATIRYTADRQQPPKTAEATVVSATAGTCTFLIQLADGTKLEPMTLAKEFQTDGLKVNVTYREHPEMASTCQLGSIVEIITIEGR